MSKIELRIKLLISGLLLLTAFLIIALIFLSPAFLENSQAVPQEESQPQEITEKTEDKTIYKKTESDALLNNKVNTKKAKEPIQENTRIASSKTNSSNKTNTTASARKKNKVLYFIIDDAGYSIEKLKPFLDFPGEITIAVLPGLAYSKQCAELALKKGKKVIVHQPMEAVNGNDTGPYAIRLGMKEEEIIKILEHNTTSMPGVIGMNNHMGSAVVADERIMKIVYKYLYNKKLFFLDSMTTPDSICKQVAEDGNYPFTKRDVFLDNIDERKAIMESINKGKSIAENKGHAVMIGHVWSSELADTMMQIYPDLIEEDFIIKDTRNFLIGE